MSLLALRQMIGLDKRYAEPKKSVKRFATDCEKLGLFDGGASSKPANNNGPKLPRLKFGVVTDSTCDIFEIGDVVQVRVVDDEYKVKATRGVSEFHAVHDNGFLICESIGFVVELD